MNQVADVGHCIHSKTPRMKLQRYGSINKMNCLMSRSSTLDARTAF
jgi:hypothetical protein